VIAKLESFTLKKLTEQGPMKNGTFFRNNIKRNHIRKLDAYVWGIGQHIASIDYYNASLRPSAFVGWTADKYIGYAIGNTLNYDHVNFIIYIQQAMFQYQLGIGAAMVNAANQTPPGWVTTSELKCFGCSDLTFGAFND